MRRLAWAGVVASILGALLTACGGSPNTPAPIPPAPAPVTPIPAPVNTAPVIESITAGASRAEVETDVTFTAVVKDAETAIDQLTFDWKADVGTFSGSGASVKWRAPKGTATPRDYTVSLTVTETYGSPDGAGVRPKNVVSGTAPVVRVHDSPKELGDLSLAFLRDFANSSVTPAACLRDFSNSCDGKDAEREDIEDNRIKFLVLGSTLNVSSVAVAANQRDAGIRVACTFSSKRLKCLANDPAGCTVGAIEPAAGICRLTAIYEQQRWWLCTSNFDPSGSLSPSMHGFLGSR